MENTKRKEIKNTVKKGNSRKYMSSRQIKKQIAALGIATGIGIASIGMPVIEYISGNIKEANGIKDAIKTAASTQKYMENRARNPIMQAVTDQEELMKIESLSNAIQDYKKLQYNKDRTLEEEKRYLEACEEILNSKNLVIDMYTDSIKAKVAKAYNITNEVEINKIVVENPIHYSTGGKEEAQIIRLSENQERLEIDSDLRNAVRQARILKDVNEFDLDRNIKDLPIRDIIYTFEEAQKFSSEYIVSVNEKGKLISEHVKDEKDKNIGREDEER